VPNVAALCPQPSRIWRIPPWASGNLLGTDWAPTPTRGHGGERRSWASCGVGELSGQALDASPAEALETARASADGKGIRIGGGPTTVREFLAAGLVDHMHTAVVPILLGRGVRLRDGLEGLEKDYQVEATSSPSGATHVTFTRALPEPLRMTPASEPNRSHLDRPPRLGRRSARKA